jgi:hypothetical protein
LAEIELIDPWVSPRLGIRFELGEELEISRPDGEPFRSPVEIAQQAAGDRAEAQAQRAEAQVQKERADALAAQLRALGVEVD